MKETFIDPKFQLNFQKPENAKFVSYSQFQNFKKCPHYWKLCHIDKLKDREATIHTVFGNAMHSVIQQWIKVLFTETIKKSDELDLSAMLLAEIKQQYASAVEKQKGQFSTKEQLAEFYLDGIEILTYLRKKRAIYFSKKYEVLIGTEIPIVLPTDPNKPNVILQGYLDLVTKNTLTGRYKIWDLKTSGKGWTQWDKKDEVKTAQLLLYKLCFSRQYNVPLDEIEVEYLILKRKIDPDSLWPQKRIQLFEPSNGKISCNKVSKMFQEFIDSCFLPDGSYNTMFNFKALTGKNCFNCRYCEFKDRDDLCPTQNRI